MSEKKKVEFDRSRPEEMVKDLGDIVEPAVIDARIVDLESDPLALWEDQFLPYQVGPIEEHYLVALDRMEIEAAIKSMSERKSEPVRERIVVLPTTMKIKYEHTCSRCGCHVGAIPGTSPEGSVWICAYCDHAQWAGRR